LASIVASGIEGVEEPACARFSFVKGNQTMPVRIVGWCRPSGSGAAVSSLTESVYRFRRHEPGADVP
jgi:hypothetical protein